MSQSNKIDPSSLLQVVVTGESEGDAILLPGKYAYRRTIAEYSVTYTFQTMDEMNDFLAREDASFPPSIPPADMSVFTGPNRAEDFQKHL